MNPRPAILALATVACGAPERPASPMVSVPSVAATATAVARPVASPAPSTPCTCPWVERGGWMHVPNGWVQHLVGVEEAWDGWRLEKAWVSCAPGGDEDWQCVYSVAGQEPKSEQELQRRVDASIDAVRPLGLEAEDGPTTYKQLGRGEDVTLMLLGGSSQLVVRGHGLLREGYADWLRRCGGMLELVDALPWDRFLHWSMEADLETETWGFVFDTEVDMPRREDSSWTIEVTGGAQLIVRRSIKPRTAAPSCDP